MPVRTVLTRLAWAYAGTITLVLLYEKILRDPGSRIFSCPDEASMETVVEILRRHHVTPQFQNDSISTKSGEHIRRVMMTDGTIINTSELAAPLMSDRRKPSAAIAVVTSTPLEAAQEAMQLICNRHGPGTAEIIETIDPTLKAGVMVGLASKAIFPGNILIFRRNRFRMGPRPQRWIPPEARR